MIAALEAAPLILLERADALAVLALFDGVVIAPAVSKETVSDAPTPIEAERIRRAVLRLKISTLAPEERIRSTVEYRYPILGAGEIETISLVLGKSADLAVLDDKLAREAARVEGVACVGSLGLLLKAVERGILPRPRLVEILEALLTNGMWLSPDVLEAFWKAVGGR